MARSFGMNLSRKITRWLNESSPGNERSLIRHLALRRDPDAVTELDRLSSDKRPGSIALSAAAMVRRVALKGHGPAAYNLAMQRFNDRDLPGYRGWLRHAAKAGDEDAIRQLRRFETRLPHGAARDIGRGRPYRLDD